MSRAPNDAAPKWWLQLPWTRICSFPVGVGIIVWEMVFENTVSVPWLLFAAAAMGILPAATVRALIRKWIGEE